MIAKLMTWVRGARWRAAAVHLLEMWGFWLVGWLASALGGVAGAAAACVMVAYYVRKQTEVRALVSPGNLLAAYDKGWLPWAWPHWLQIDFYIPAGVAIGTAVVVNLL